MLFPIETVREVAQILSDQGLGEISLETAGARLTLKRPPHVAPVAPVEDASEIAEPETLAGQSTETAVPATLSITSPAVGVFREAKTPRQEGEEVAKKAILGAVETLNIPTELIAPVAARITKILAIEGQRVEWGQPLLELEPVDAQATSSS